MKEIVGYADQISVRPGQAIKIMVSCDGIDSYHADLVQVIHGDVNPDGPGFKAEPVESGLKGPFNGRKQEIHAGSFAVVPSDPRFDLQEGFTLQAMIWPTTPELGRRQTILGRWSEDAQNGYRLIVDEGGALALVLGDGVAEPEVLSTAKRLLAREWYFVGATYDSNSREIMLYQEPLAEYAMRDTRAQTRHSSGLGSTGTRDVPFLIGGHFQRTQNGRTLAKDHYNGKIDRPRVAKRALGRTEMALLGEATVAQVLERAVVAAWDFSIGMSSIQITDVSPNRLHGALINLPARAMKGFNWTGEEMNWKHALDQYGAIHFHDDDLYDAGWEADFELVVPDGARSGIYAVHLHTDGAEDYIPFFVRPKEGGPTADIALLIPTASYMAYANEHMPTNAPLAQLLTGQVAVLYPEDVFLNEHREYGASTYDTHTDGSGVCYSSRLRPILNMRPKYASWLGGSGSSLWQFNADTHITDWLEAMGHTYDVVTDEDLHYQGLNSISPYRVVLTGTHPEYWSKEMRDSLQAYKRSGGRLMYLGANGWYWRIAYHPELPGVIEVRKGEGGIRAWAAEPGEYYHSFTGEYGGLWRRSGYPPQQMAGTGFTAQGFDISSYYRRQPDSFDPRASFIFQGIDEEELIGDFGLIGGGAAGLELDRYDVLLGTPPNALLLASSENHTDIYLVVLEEILINYPGATGQQSELVRADMVFFETLSGGAVFATSSIAWSGSLSHNDYDNNVARITDNVLRRFLDEKPFRTT